MYSFPISEEQLIALEEEGEIGYTFIIFLIKKRHSKNWTERSCSAETGINRRKIQSLLKKMKECDQKVNKKNGPKEGQDYPLQPAPMLNTKSKNGPKEGQDYENSQEMIKYCSINEQSVDNSKNLDIAIEPISDSIKLNRTIKIWGGGASIIKTDKKNVKHFVKEKDEIINIYCKTFLFEKDSLGENSLLSVYNMLNKNYSVETLSHAIIGYSQNKKLMKNRKKPLLSYIFKNNERVEELANEYQNNLIKEAYSVEKEYYCEYKDVAEPESSKAHCEKKIKGRYVYRAGNLAVCWWHKRIISAKNGNETDKEFINLTVPDYKI